MRKLGMALVALASAMAAFAFAWSRNKRLGTHVMNDIVNPIIVRRGIAGSSRLDVATIEHVGRRSGARRLTPVHAVATVDGFRIIVPLGPESQWVRNVVAARHCRMQLRGTIYELDEPLLVHASDVRELPFAARWLFGRLGFEFLLLHRFADAPGTFEPMPGAAVLEEPAWAPAFESTFGEPEATDSEAEPALQA